MTAPHRGFDQGAGYVFRHIARPSLCRVDGDHMQRVIVLPTHHVAHDGVSIGLGGDRFHICDSERAEVAEDEMQFKIEVDAAAGHPAKSPQKRRVCWPAANLIHYRLVIGPSVSAGCIEEPVAWGITDATPD